MYNYYNPYAQPTPTPYGVNRQEVVRVNGKNGAEAYQMAPNSSILLLDETAPIVWLKTTDGASYPTLSGYRITPIETQVSTTSMDYSKLEERIAKIEEYINGGQSDVKPARTIIKKSEQ